MKVDNSKYNFYIQRFISIACATLVIIHFVLLRIVTFDAVVTKGIYLILALIIMLLFVAQEYQSKQVFILIISLAILILVSGISFICKFSIWGLPNYHFTSFDYAIFAIIFLAMLIGSFYASRRWMTMALILLLFVVSNLPYLGGITGPHGMSIDRMISSIFFSDEGVLGNGIGTIVDYALDIFLLNQIFIQFGAPQYIYNLSLKLLRKKTDSSVIAFVASILLGMVTINTRRNVLNLGPSCYEHMCREGYKPEYSMGLIASSSVCSAFEMPMLSVGAIYMANQLHITYSSIGRTLIIPLFLIYLGMAVGVILHKNVHEDALTEASAIVCDPDFCWTEGLDFVIPILFMLFSIICLGWPLSYCVRSTIIIAVVVHYCRMLCAKKNINIHQEGVFWKDVFDDTCEIVVPLSVNVVCLGAFFGLLYGSSLHYKLMSLIYQLFNGHSIALCICVAILCLFLGSRMPGLPAYIMIIELFSDNLNKLGISGIVAYTFMLIYINSATIGPFKGRVIGIASNLIHSNFRLVQKESVVIAYSLYLVPVLLVAHQELLSVTNIFDSVVTLLCCSLGIIILGVSCNYFVVKKKILSSIVLLVLSIACFIGNLYITFLSFVLFVIVISSRFVRE